MKTPTIAGRFVRAFVPALLVLASCAARPTELELEQIRNALDLHPGAIVADVGAGDGDWSVRLARQVGESGEVFATEVEDEHVESIRRRVERDDLDNVKVVLGDQDHTGLPDACCDAILLRLVYHHFTDPDAMRASLHRALRPGGLIAVIEIEPQTHWPDLEGVPDRGGHGIPADTLIEEMAAAGFDVVERHEPWEGQADRYCVVFGR